MEEQCERKTCEDCDDFRHGVRAGIQRLHDMYAILDLNDTMLVIQALNCFAKVRGCDERCRSINFLRGKLEHLVVTGNLVDDSCTFISLPAAAVCRAGDSLSQYTECEPASQAMQE